MVTESLNMEVIQMETIVEEAIAEEILERIAIRDEEVITQISDTIPVVLGHIPIRMAVTTTLLLPVIHIRHTVKIQGLIINPLTEKAIIHLETAHEALMVIMMIIATENPHQWTFIIMMSIRDHLDHRIVIDTINQNNQYCSLVVRTIDRLNHQWRLIGEFLILTLISLGLAILIKVRLNFVLPILQFITASQLWHNH
jgi:hypothetical protein